VEQEAVVAGSGGLAADLDASRDIAGCRPLPLSQQRCASGHGGGEACGGPADEEVSTTSPPVAPPTAKAVGNDTSISN
jgi:hypothetical protein